MSPQIYIDDEAFGALGDMAKPFVETEPNDVIRRLVGLDDEASQAEIPTATATPGTEEFKQQVVRRVVAKRQRSAKAKATRSRAKKGTVLEEEAYYVPILRALEERGGMGPASEVINRVGELIDDELKPADREAMETGALRWKARAQFARMHMKEQGLLKPESPRGVWEISEAGRQHLQASSASNAA